MKPQGAPQSFTATIARLHAAMAKVANGDISGILALYTQTDAASSFYGWGGYEKGWGAASRRWDWAGQQFKGGTVSYENVTAVVTAELAYTTDIETFNAHVANMDRRHNGRTGLRTSFDLRTANGGWFIAMPTVLKGSTPRQRGWSRAPVPTWRQGVTEFKPLAQIHQGNGRPPSPPPSPILFGFGARPPSASPSHCRSSCTPIR